MGPQGKRWPKWKQRRDNSSQDVTDENRRKKLHHGVKCIRKVRKPRRATSANVHARPSTTPSSCLTTLTPPPALFSPRAQALKKARTFEERKIQRRIAQQEAAAAAAKALADKGKSKKAAKLGPPPTAIVDQNKLAQQLAAVRVLDLESLGQHVGDSTLEAVLASRDAPSADAALPGDNDDSRAKSEKAVGEKAVAAGGSQPALVVARRVLAAACVREEVNSLQEKLVLVGDRQEWAKGRLAREEAR